MRETVKSSITSLDGNSARDTHPDVGKKGEETMDQDVREFLKQV